MALHYLIPKISSSHTQRTCHRPVLFHVWTTCSYQSLPPWRLADAAKSQLFAQLNRGRPWSFGCLSPSVLVWLRVTDVRGWQVVIALLSGFFSVPHHNSRSLWICWMWYWDTGQSTLVELWCLEMGIASIRTSSKSLIQNLTQHRAPTTVSQFLRSIMAMVLLSHVAESLKLNRFKYTNHHLNS